MNDWCVGGVTLKVLGSVIEGMEAKVQSENRDLIVIMKTQWGKLHNWDTKMEG